MIPLLPRLFQGGMGLGVSSRLARETSKLGCLGIVSCAGADIIVARLLQLGDPGGHLQRAFSQFPVFGVADRVLKKFFIPGGIGKDESFAPLPMFTFNPSKDLMDLVVLSNFALIWLAKEDHKGVVGANYLERAQMGHLWSLFGAILAGVDVVIMGAGIPLQVPGVLDCLAKLEEASYRISVEGAGPGDDFRIVFNPKESYNLTGIAQLRRPAFLPIVSSSVLARILYGRSSGKIDGLVVENTKAGGHNAPERSGRKSGNSEPDLEKIRKLNLPFWLAGAYASPEKIKAALEMGAAGVQVGSIFALSEESNLSGSIKGTLRRMAFRGELVVHTNLLASPSGYPFKIANLPNSLADSKTYCGRKRHCDLSRLGSYYKKDDGTLGFRCPAEPIENYRAKGGKMSTEGRVCLCNALLANIGLGQRRGGYMEPPLITLGEDLSFVRRIIRDENSSYTARDVIDYLLSEIS